MRIGVLGLGLIGGSLARDLARLGHDVAGGDADEGAVEAAMMEGVIGHRLGVDGDGIDACDVAILALPVQHIPRLLHELAPRLQTCALVMDTGSTKAAIGAAAAAAGIRNFIGAHPLAGEHRSGWSASRPGLFNGARTFLCPSHSGDGAALQLATTLWASVGAQPVVMDATAHDEQLAWTSHLPQLTATALACSIASAGARRAELGSGGNDMTRLAGSDPEMWTGIARQNGTALLLALAQMQEELDALRAAIEAEDDALLRRRFEAARMWFQS